MRIKEFELLWYLASREGEVISKSELLEKVWGYDYYEDANTVNVHIHRIREKLEKHDFYPTLLQLCGALVISLKGADNYFSIRSQIIIGVISSVILTTIILVIAYKLMWFNGHMTLTLAITTMITSCLTLSICSIFINPLIQKIKQFNIKTKQFINHEKFIDDETFQSPREIKELNDSFNKMAYEINNQMNMIKTSNKKN